MNLQDNKTAKKKLQKLAEAAKIELSNKDVARVQAENIIDTNDLDVTITRADFEQVVDHIQKRCIR